MANAGNAHVPANEVIVINIAMIKTILNGITPAIRNRIMYSPGPVFMVIPFSSISRLFHSHRPKKAKITSPAIVPTDNNSLVRSVVRKYATNGTETRVRKTAQRRTWFRYRFNDSVRSGIPLPCEEALLAASLFSTVSDCSGVGTCGHQPSLSKI